MTHSETTALALKCLSMLVHDDFDLVVPVLPRILVRVLQVRCFELVPRSNLSIVISGSRLS